MSGHSHWSNIQHKKEIEDKKRSALFARLSHEIALAVKQGGPDPKNNAKLQAAIDKAKKNNLPKEKILSAIDRALGIGQEGQLEEVLYEVFGPYGSAFLVQISTDNKNRTSSEFKHLVELAGGSFAHEGSVKWMFDQIGKIVMFAPKDISEENLQLKIIDWGVEDFTKEGEKIIIYTNSHKLKEIEQKIKNENYDIEFSEMIWKAKNVNKISDEMAKSKIMEFEEELKSYQDTERVFSNTNF